MNRRHPWIAAVLAAITAACATNPPAQPAAAAPTMAAPADTSSRPRPYPVLETRAFAQGIEQGTRTRSGAPGPNYWQQWSRYRIEATYDPATGALEGRSTITYLNRSPANLSALYLHLHGNLFSPEAVKNRSVPTTGGVTLTRVAVRGQEVQQFSSANPRGYRVNGTIMGIQMSSPVAAGDSVALELAWKYTVPPNGAPRGGRDSTVAFVSYWYPQMAVHDDVNGWQIDPYMANAEFYMGYGEYDVAITVPAGYLIGATGTLQNPDEVLSAQTRERLGRARTSDSVVQVVTAADQGAGKATASGQRLTWRFRAEQVRDFAWGVSRRYNWTATRAVTGDADGDGAADTALIHSFWVAGENPGDWPQNARYGRFSIEFLSRFLWPYPYPQMTSIQGTPSCGGMEFPMITCIGGSGWNAANMFGVTVHEIGHMWFPMQVGSDEKRHSWQDEGLTQFNEGNAELEFFDQPESSTITGAQRAYIGLAQADREVELMRHGDLYPSYASFGVASYMKTAAILHMLRGMLGEETFMRAYREYGRRWQWKHPTPFDLFNTFEDVAGRDLDWFWRTWFYETWTLDQAVGRVSQAADGATIVIEDRGLAPMPAVVTVTYEGGRTEQLTVPVETWLRGARQATLSAPAGTVAKVEIDAAKHYPDVDRTNNVWTAAAASN
ncbi:MAG TPA: M1 family metallopeptidase [Gemmatimonadales bacterium]|nr:M1 family metallopeptidase [Gemmatimonadales bacterium]